MSRVSFFPTIAMGSSLPSSKYQHMLDTQPSQSIGRRAISASSAANGYIPEDSVDSPGSLDWTTHFPYIDRLVAQSAVPLRSCLYLTWRLAQSNLHNFDATHAGRTTRKPSATSCLSQQTKKLFSHSLSTRTSPDLATDCMHLEHSSAL